MTATITKEFPDIAQEYRTVAMLAELLQLANDTDNAYKAMMREQSPEKKQEFEALYGVMADIESACTLAHENLARSLIQISEHDIEQAYQAGIITTLDRDNAIKAKRLQELERTREVQKDLER